MYEAMIFLLQGPLSDTISLKRADVTLALEFTYPA